NCCIRSDQKGQEKMTTLKKYGKSVKLSRGCCLCIAFDAAGVDENMDYARNFGLKHGEMERLSDKHFRRIEIASNTLGAVLRDLPMVGTFLVCAKIKDYTIAGKTIDGRQPSAGKLFYRDSGRIIFDGYDEHAI